MYCTNPTLSRRCRIHAICVPHMFKILGVLDEDKPWETTKSTAGMQENQQSGHSIETSNSTSEHDLARRQGPCFPEPPTHVKNNNHDSNNNNNGNSEFRSERNKNRNEPLTAVVVVVPRVVVGVPERVGEREVVYGCGG